MYFVRFFNAFLLLRKREREGNQRLVSEGTAIHTERIWDAEMWGGKFGRVGVKEVAIGKEAEEWDDGLWLGESAFLMVIDYIGCRNRCWRDLQSKSPSPVVTPTYPSQKPCFRLFLVYSRVSTVTSPHARRVSGKLPDPPPLDPAWRRSGA